MRFFLFVYLLIMSVFFVFSAYMYSFQGNPEKWFSRLALGLILLGFIFVGTKENE